MLMKNCNAFDFTHKQIFKTLMRDNLDWSPFKVGGGGPGHLHTLPVCTFLRPPLISLCLMYLQLLCYFYALLLATLYLT